MRELDVAIQDAKKYSGKSTRLKLRRKKAGNDFQNLIHRKKITREFSRVGNKMKTTSQGANSETRNKLRALLIEQLKKKLQKQSSFHKLRITLKKVRYILEALDKPIGPIESIQRLLGEIHDLEILQSLLGTLPKAKIRQMTLSRRAVRAAKPAIHFALKQL